MVITGSTAAETSYTTLNYLVYGFERRLEQIQASIMRKQTTAQSLNSLERKDNPAALLKGLITDSPLLGHFTLSSYFKLQNKQLFKMTTISKSLQILQKSLEYLFFLIVQALIPTLNDQITLPLSKQGSLSLQAGRSERCAGQNNSKFCTFQTQSSHAHTVQKPVSQQGLQWACLRFLNISRFYVWGIATGWDKQSISSETFQI